MPSKTFNKNLYEAPFNAIKSGKKTVEIRANKNIFSGDSVNLIEKGDFIGGTLIKSKGKKLALKLAILGGLVGLLVLTPLIYFLGFSYQFLNLSGPGQNFLFIGLSILVSALIGWFIGVKIRK